ncbi:Transcription factor Opi1 [Macrophomina phaseolina MS6]|uniref:Transcription factor Opi1 n=1 Tax=Macrophomina phaseolina (strain MS6) TaxID=1126212 RepID=K2R941_MACPH|nr:Transcription factor Opi1 [Macrophomina phaseolina MS6]
MEVQEERPPPYTHNDPDTLQLPSVPTQDPPRVVPAATSSATNGVHLPDLKSLGLPVASHSRSASTPLDNYGPALFPKHAVDTQQWQSPGIFPHTPLPRAPVTAPRSAAEMDIGSPMDTESIVSMDEQVNGNTHKATRSQKELLAAEAIAGLGNPDYVMSPPGRSATLPPSSDHSSSQEREPLLSLVTSRHPWIGNTINGSLSAYSTTKTYSPRFVQSSADFLERNFANTVGTVGRRTGVESSLRRYLGERANEGESGSHKRRRMDNDMMDIEQGLQTPPVRAARTRGDSDISSAREETLPPYDTERSPDYEERPLTNGHTSHHGQLALLNGSDKQRGESSQSPHWSTRVMITTSGLGVALSEKSLRSLKFCLRLLREASAHIGTAMRALRMVLEDFERTTSSSTSNQQQTNEKGVGSRQLMRDMEEKRREEESRRLADRINTLSQEIWETLKKVCASVSQYTGGALPENASNLVRRQLLSVPQRWQAANVASTQSGHEGERGESAEVRGANRMVAFGKEGLDMIAQVSMVVESTIKSAEQWLDSMGRKRTSSSAPNDEKSANGLPTTEVPSKN